MQRNDKKCNFSKSKLFLSLMFSAGMLAGSANKVLAQSIIPASDTTGTIVTPTGPQFDIRGGQLSGDGANLFHSFQLFNLSNGQIANFISHPDIHNILGRINGNQASYINGLIQVSGGNSNLFLMNPAGILFGPNASLNVPADFTATTSTSIGFNGNSFNAIGDNNWATLVGNPSDFSFAITQPGSIVNLGNLTLKPGNNLTLLAGTILNTGTLSSSGGNITLAAVEGESRIRISQPGNLLNVEVNAENLAGGGNLNPLSLPELLTGVGISEASGLRVNGDGTVTLTNSNFSTDGRVGTTIVSGNINVSSPLATASFTGGEVNIFGSRVGLIGANIDASGVFGGGVVRVGGDYKGQGILPNALYTFASSDSLINVSALQNGNGGRAIIWADDSTRFLGTILARGGQFSGNGGFVETSGKQFLEVTQTPDITAPAGMGGTWLLDPNDINIVAGGGSSNISNSGGVFSTTNDSAQIGVNLILAALNGGGNVTLETGNAGTNLEGGDINLNTPLDFNGRGNGTLTLNAANNININANITDSVVGGDSLNLNFNAGGGLNITNAIINTGGGNITAVAGTNAISPVGITINNSTINASGGNISLNGTGGNIPLGGNNYGIWIYTNSIIQTNGIGTISLNGTGGDIPFGSNNYGIFIQNNSTIQTTDTATISLNGTGGSGTDVNYGFLIQDAGSKISSQNGDINITGNGGNGSGQFNLGIAILGGAVVESTGSAKITLNGTGGSGTNNNLGIAIQGNGSKISSQNGDINLTGNGGGNGTGQLNAGIMILNGAGIESTDTAKINLNGTGGSGTNNNFGISIQVGGSKVSSQNGDINIIGNGGNGTGNLNRGINIANTGVVESTGTATITLNGTGGSGIDNNDGISIQDAGSKISSQNGDLNIIGTAGNSTGGYNTGIALLNGGVVESTGTAKINLNGTGGSGTLGNVGINILDAGSKISSQNGDINLIGAGGNSSGEFNAGINLSNGGIVESTGTAKINLNGTGGSGTNENRGININGAGSKISSQNGDINITGATTDTGNGNRGVSFQNSSILESTAGDITVTGNSAAGASISIADSFINPNGSTGTLTLQADQLNFTGTNQINSNLTLSAVPNSTNPLTISGDISFSNPLTITATSLDTTGSTLTGTNNAPLSLISSGNIVTGNIINPGGNITFNTPGNITLNNNLDTSTTAGGSGGNIIFTGDVTLAQPLTLNTVGTLGSGNITFNNRVNSTTAAETLTLNTGIGNITFNGAVGDITPLAALTINNTGTTQFNNAVTVESLTTDSGGTTSISGNITTTGSSGQNYGETVTLVGDITLTGDEINFANTVSGNGNLTLQPYTASSPISLSGANDNAVGTLDLTAAEIGLLQNNFNSITIGRTDSTGLISLAGDTTFSDPLTLRSPAGNGAINTQNFTLTGTDNASFTLQANSDITTGNIITSGGGITINSTTGNVNTSAGILDAGSSAVNGGEITLSAGTNITPADIKTPNNNITFNSPVNLVNDAEFSSNGGIINFVSTVDGNQNLTINTGTGNITFNGAVGNTNPLTSLIANSAGTTQFYNSINVVNLTTDNGGSTQLNGNITSNGIVNFNDAVSLANAVIISTNNNNLSFGNTLDGNQNLTINAGTGNITFNGAVGSLTPLTGITINSANIEANFTVSTGTNGVNINAGDTIKLDQNLQSAGVVNLTSAGNITTADITSPAEINLTTTNGNITAGNINTSSNTVAGGNINLTSNTGTITSGNLNASGATDGGNIGVIASTEITVGEINSSGNSGRGGNVLLDPSGDIQVTSINAQGATEGGNIDITTGRYFRATGTFQNANGENVSLSSFGPNNSGSITIRHGGNGITPFVIGDALTNGTAGSIISGSDNLSTGSFPYTFTIGKIAVISVPEPPPIEPPPVETPPLETPVNEPLPAPQLPVNDVPVQPSPTPQLPVNDVPVPTQTPQQLPVNDVPVPTQTPQQLPVKDVPVQTEPLQNEQQTSVDETTFFRRLLKALDNPGFLVRDQILTYENSQISQLSDSAKWLYIKEIAKFAQIQEKDYENLLANSDPTKLLMKFKELASSQLLIVSKKYENNYNNNSGESSISSNSNSTNPPQFNNISTTTIITNPLTQLGDNYQIIWEIEQKRNIEYQEHFGIETKTLSQEILLPTLQETLKTVATQTGKRAAIIYTLAYKDQLLLILVPPDNSPIYYNIPQAPKEKLLSVVNNLIQETTNITRLTRNSYLAPSQQLYQWIIAPLEKDLKQLQIDTLLFSLDPGLRSLPLAAMHDGKEFLIEKYSLSLIPSFTLIDSNYASIRGAKVLAMGASQLTNQNPLPGVPVELQSIRLNNWKTQSFLNQEFTLKNLINQRQNQPYEIIHLATHADFQPGDPSNSYIQLWDRKLLLSELPTMNWKTPPVELLVLSACRTAFGDKQAELGFGGLAIQAGVKSALASLWYVSDKGTLALMNGFYGNLLSSGIKAEALRQAQLDMIHGKINIQGNKMITRAGVLLLPEELSTNRIALFSHPYYWSGFTLIGSPW